MIERANKEGLSLQLTHDWLDVARRTLMHEADALQAAVGRVDESFVRAAQTILTHSGKVIISGLGKSGLVGQKIAATLSSTGTPAVFMHPAEAVHGDLGIYSPGDPTILLSKNGTTGELLRLIPILKQFRSPLIGILGNIGSPLAAGVDVVLDASVAAEADPLDLAPTSSSTLAMAVGDALAAILMHARGFTPEDFARFHPAGQLGRNLLQVRDVMHRQIAYAKLTTPLREVVVEMTRYPLGAACVIADDGRLLGIITDGDLRRALFKFDDIRTVSAADIMTARAVTVSESSSLSAAARLMKDRPSQISVLPVIAADARCCGLIRIHDIYQQS